MSKSAYWRIEPWTKDNEEIIKLLPKTASVATQQNLVPLKQIGASSLYSVEKN